MNVHVAVGLAVDPLSFNCPHGTLSGLCLSKRRNVCAESSTVRDSILDCNCSCSQRPGQSGVSRTQAFRDPSSPPLRQPLLRLPALVPLLETHHPYPLGLASSQLSFPPVNRATGHE